jgi:hypothetical protein
VKRNTRLEQWASRIVSWVPVGFQQGKMPYVFFFVLVLMAALSSRASHGAMASFEAACFCFRCSP